MKLARVIRSGGLWSVVNPSAVNPSAVIDKPPIGTIVQYKQSVEGRYDVYFPGVQGYAPMGGYGFSTHFEDLDDETS